MIRFQQRRGGFTLVELLVVLAIISTLTLMLIPAIQKVRELANKNTCSNNFRQLALAVNTYAETNKVFPTEGTTAATTFYSKILPYVEQQGLYSQVSSGGSAAPVKTFMCPSRRSNTSSAPACDYAFITGYVVPGSPTPIYSILGTPGLTLNTVAGGSRGPTNMLFLTHKGMDNRTYSGGGLYDTGWNTTYGPNLPGDHVRYGDGQYLTDSPGNPATGFGSPHSPPFLSVTLGGNLRTDSLPPVTTHPGNIVDNPWWPILYPCVLPPPPPPPYEEDDGGC